jgi:hypothetical protein
MVKIAQYLVFHWDKGTFCDIDNNITQSLESCDVPEEITRVEDMKKIFSDFLDRKYGIGRWKMEYWLGYKYWITNTYDPKREDAKQKFIYSAPMRQSQRHRIWQEHLYFVGKHEIGSPRETDKYSVAELVSMGMVGLYSNNF